MDNALTELINAIKEMAPSVWNAYIKQANITGLSWVVAVGFFLIATGVTSSIAKFKRRFYSSDEMWWEKESWVFAAVVMGFLFLCAVVLFLLFGLSPLLNPEYWAINNLLSNVR